MIPYLRPDGKSQVTIAYEGTTAKRVDTVLISAQHREEVDVETLLAPDVRSEVIDPVLREFELDADGARILVNPTGRFEIGGPKADTGLTGRKIIVDSYGGMAPHGGGCFSGKDPTKVDRSAAYMARYVAKNLVAAGAADRLQIQVAYAIGAAHPVSLAVDTFGTEQVDPAASWTSCGTRSTFGRPRSSGTWIFAARSTRTRPPTATSAARSSPGRRPTARMSSAARSGSAASRFVPRAPRETRMRVLSGPVSVCIDRPLLALDRAFTYDLPEELGAGLGSWCRSRSTDAPPARGCSARPTTCPSGCSVRKLVSAVRSFDERSLALFRAMSERYVAPLATVIGRAVPPRVASEETSSGPCRRRGGLCRRRGPHPSRPTAAARGCCRRFGRGRAHSWSGRRPPTRRTSP